MVLTAFEVWLLEMICRDNLSSSNFRRSAAWIAAQLNVECVPLEQWSQRHAVMAGLLERGLLDLFPRNLLEPISNTDLFSRVGGDILDGYIPFKFDVSPAGAEVWEAFAAPLWSQYCEIENLRDCVGLNGHREKTIIVEAGSEQALDEHVKRYMDADAEFSSSSIIYRGVLEEWNIRMWKTLRNASLAVFCLGGPPPDFSNRSLRQRVEVSPWLSRGYGSGCRLRLTGFDWTVEVQEPGKALPADGSE